MRPRWSPRSPWRYTFHTVQQVNNTNRRDSIYRYIFFAGCYHSLPLFSFSRSSHSHSFASSSEPSHSLLTNNTSNSPSLSRCPRATLDSVVITIALYNAETNHEKSPTCSSALRICLRPIVKHGHLNHSRLPDCGLCHSHSTNHCDFLSRPLLQWWRIWATNHRSTYQRRWYARRQCWSVHQRWP